MSNDTELGLSTHSYSDYPLPLIIFVRINAAVILVENLVVALCLFTHRHRYYRKEFWLQLVCLNVSDMFSGVVMMLLSFINYDTINKTSWGCSGLFLSILVSQLASMYNVLIICVYRFFTLICSLRCRFRCKMKVTILQIIFVYLFCSTYSTIPFVMWANKNQTINACTAENLLSDYNEQSVGLFAGGVFLPLIILNVLYLVTFCKLRGNWKRGSRYVWTFNAAKTRTAGLKSNDRNVIERSNHRKINDGTSLSDVESGCSNNHICFIDGAVQTDMSAEINYDFCPCRLSQNKLQRESRKGPKQGEKPMLGRQAGRLYLRRNSFKISDQKDSIQQTEQKEESSVNTERVHLPFRDTCMRNEFVPELESQDRRDNFYRGYNRNIQRQSLILIGIIMLCIDITTFLPILINTLEFMQSWQKPTVFPVIFTVIILNNALINPWVYSFQSKAFRLALKDNISKICEMLCCRQDR